MNMIEKLKLTQRAGTIKKQLSDKSLSLVERLPLLNEFKSIMAQLKAGAVKAAPVEPVEPVEPIEPEDERVINFRSNQYTSLPLKEFKSMATSVHELGMELDEIKTGVVAWLESNPELVAA